ncbi:MAG: signal peptide peptidase SppA [Candidatus Latescibacteria bacterium]|nr:signal peptide peptidase SppA [Candidatus Latescibacterota bacterium]
MAKKSDWIIGGALGASILLLVFVAGIALIGSLMERDGEFSYAAGKRIALVEVTGVIRNARSVVAQLARYREDGSVPAIVVRIDSPGGEVAPTQEIFDEIRKTRKAGKKVVASMGGVAASGGYYIACAADSIVANPGTLTGSIGVIFELPNVEGLFKKLGVDWEVVKSGKYKDIGSLARELTDEERRLLQAVVDDVYVQFIDAIVQNRRLSRDQVMALADGRVFTGHQAKTLGLVDRTGTYEDAIALAARMVGMTGKPKTIRARGQNLLDVLFDNFETATRTTDSSLLLEYRLR